MHSSAIRARTSNEDKKATSPGLSPGFQPWVRQFKAMCPEGHRGRGRERRRGRERLGKRRTGTKTHDCGYRLYQSDRSIGSALQQHACGFSCLLPSPIVLVVVLVLGLDLFVRSRLEKQPTDLQQHRHYMRDGTLRLKPWAKLFCPSGRSPCTLP